jgi:hypothetical protein
VVEKIDHSRIASVRQCIEGHPECIGVERIEREDDEVARRIIGDARVAANDSQVVAAQPAFLRGLEVLFRDLVQAGRELDAPRLTKRVLRGEDHRTPEAGTDVDEGRALDNARRQHCDHRAEVVDGHGFVVCRMRASVADALGIEIGEEEHGVCSNTVVVIEPASAAARFRHG